MKTYVLLVILWLSELYCHESHSDESDSHHSHHSHHHLRTNPYKEMYYWDNVEFQFPSECARNISLSTGSYVPQNNTIWAIQVWKDKIFATVFRHKSGALSSLNYFLRNTTTKSPVLIPYPSYGANYVSEATGQRTDSLTSNSTVVCATYIRIDKCDRLWVIDGGFADFFGEHRVVTPPALVIFDLNTDKLIRRYTIPEEFVNLYTAYFNLDLDFVDDSCDEVYAYIVDLFRSIVVYSFKQNRSWRVTHNLFGSEPSKGYFIFKDNLHNNWNFGAFGIAIGEHHRDGSKRVYVTPLSSTKTYYIWNKMLQNETYIALNDYYQDVRLVGDRGKRGQIFNLAYDEKTHVLFDTQFYRQQIGCLNTANRYRYSNTAVVFRKKQLFFPVDVSIGPKRNIWIVSTDIPTFFKGTWKTNVKNIRIFKAKVDDVIAGTVCKHSQHD